jgi:hypothetical protein
MAQNADQPMLLQNLIHNLNLGENAAHKNVGYFCHFKKKVQVNNLRLGENSPNLVTLFVNAQPF